MEFSLHAVRHPSKKVVEKGPQFWIGRRLLEDLRQLQQNGFGACPLCGTDMATRPRHDLAELDPQCFNVTPVVSHRAHCGDGRSVPQQPIAPRLPSPNRYRTDTW